jgi:hypothetical protein
MQDDLECIEVLLRYNADALGQDSDGHRMCVCVCVCVCVVCVIDSNRMWKRG